MRDWQVEVGAADGVEITCREGGAGHGCLADLPVCLAFGRGGRYWRLDACRALCRESLCAGERRPQGGGAEGRSPAVGGGGCFAVGVAQGFRQHGVVLGPPVKWLR